MNIYEALRASHELQRQACQALVKSRPVQSERAEIFKKLRIELEAHAAAEERFLYCVMMQDDAGLTCSRHALSEHHEIDEIIGQMRVPSLTQRGWLQRAKKLSETVHHHLQEEEKGIFQLSGKILSEKQKLTLGKQYLKDYERLKKALSES